MLYIKPRTIVTPDRLLENSFRPGRYGLRFVAGDDPTEHVIEFLVK